MDFGTAEASGWLGAKSCFHRATYSDEVAPPTDSMEEAYRRYGMPHPPSELVREGKTLNGCIPEPTRQEVTNDCSDRGGVKAQNGQTTDDGGHCKDSISSSASTLGSASCFEAPPTPAGLEEVKYKVLMEATAGFNRTPYKEGGHKVGEGGFGEVFQCSLVLQGGPVHAAVKVLLNKVRQSYTQWNHSSFP